MPFVQGKCESCGGILTVDPSLKAANCPFCGVAYVVQDSINYYNTTIKVENLHADTVNISDESSADGRMRAADALMKLGKYDLAEIDYRKVTNLTPQKYQGWIGLIESHTYRYTKRIKSARELNMLTEYINAVKTFAPAELVASLTAPCISYINAEVLKNTNEIESFKSVISGQQNKIADLNGQYNSLISSASQCQGQVEALNRKLKDLQSSSGFLYVCCCIGVLLALFSAIPLTNGIIGFFLFLLITGLSLISLPIMNAIRKSSTAYKIQESRNLASENLSKSNSILVEKNSLQNALVANQKMLAEYN